MRPEYPVNREDMNKSLIKHIHELCKVYQQTSPHKKRSANDTAYIENLIKILEKPSPDSQGTLHQLYGCEYKSNVSFTNTTASALAKALQEFKKNEINIGDAGPKLAKKINDLLQPLQEMKHHHKGKSEQQVSDYKQRG